MKTNAIRAAMIMLVMLPIFVLGQTSPVESVYEKYAGKEGFTSVNINKELFKMMMNIEIKGEGTEKAQELQEMMEQLHGLKVISYDDSVNVSKVKSLYKEFSGLFPSSQYKEMMSIQEDGESVKFLVKEAGDGKIAEFVMLALDKDEVTLLSLSGLIDMETISEISSKMNFEGMENLKKMKDKKK
jgi:hypothetical protein